MSTYTGAGDGTSDQQHVEAKDKLTDEKPPVLTAPSTIRQYSN